MAVVLNGHGGTVGYIHTHVEYYHDSIIVTMKGLQFELVRIITAIDFSNNNFHGEIPSLNKLRGCIPPLLGNLKALESLDLCSNKLVGKISWQLGNLNFLGVLDLSQNQLTGPIPWAPHFDTFRNTSFAGNLGLCGFPLSKECIRDETLQAPSKLEDDTHSTNGFGWKVVLIGNGCGMVLIGNGCGMVFGMIIGYLVSQQESLDGF